MSLTKISNNSLSAISTLPSAIPVGALTLLSTQTASSSASIEFTSGIDSTYSSYIFKYINVHPSKNDLTFSFNLSTDGGSNYNVTKTTTNFRARHNEADTTTALQYRAGSDLAQSTADQFLSTCGNLDDESVSGMLQIFNPSSDTFVKHFIGTDNGYDHGDESRNVFVAGYANTTSAVNAIIFKFASGNIDDGIIKMYGVS